MISPLGVELAAARDEQGPNAIMVQREESSGGGSRLSGRISKNGKGGAGAAGQGAALADGSTRGRALILCLRVKVIRFVPLVQLTRWFSKHAIIHASAPYRRPLTNGLGPTLNVLVFLNLQELGRFVKPDLCQAAVPGPDGNVGDRVDTAQQVL